MSKSFTSWAALKAALQQEMADAMEECIDKSFEDAHKNVDDFYNSPQGTYKRTGQLAESVEQSITGGGDHLVGQIRLDTTFKYNPSGRDTNTIYGYAEHGELLGNGHFWQRTEEDIEKNIQESFGKRFGK